MKKLRLPLDDLVVESFETIRDVPGEGGTIHGNAPPQSYINQPCDSRFGGCPLSDNDPTCVITQCEQHTCPICAYP